MIRRYVFFRFEHAHRGKDAMRDILRETHRVLQNVPGVEMYEIGTPADEKAVAAWDLSITATFASKAVLESYIQHPQHRAYVDGFIKPKLEVIKAWNFVPNESDLPERV